MMRWFVVVGLCWTLLAPQTQAEETPSSETSQEDEYRLGPEDVVQILVWGRADLTGDARVGVSGNIQLPLVGTVTANGLTAIELSNYLTERYKLLDPSIPEVIASITQYNSQSVAVVGEVRNPGRYGFMSIPDLWRVLLKAGGTTPQADLAHVQIAHKDKPEDQQHTLTVDLSKGIEKTAPEDLPQLLPKDTIIVPSLAEHSVTGDKFQVLGAVRNPGAYRITAAENVVEAISISGGSLPDADLRKVRLTRKFGSGSVSFELNVRNYLYDARGVGNLELKPGDTIMVPHGGGSTANSVLNAIIRSAPLISMITSVTSLVIALR